MLDRLISINKKPRYWAGLDEILIKNIYFLVDIITDYYLGYSK